MELSPAYLAPLVPQGAESLILNYSCQNQQSEEQIELEGPAYLTKPRSPFPLVLFSVGSIGPAPQAPSVKHFNIIYIQLPI